MILAAYYSVHDTIVSLLVVALVAAAVYFLCRLAGRPDWGAIGACLVVIVGALLILT